MHTSWQPGLVLLAAVLKACASQFAHFAKVESCQWDAENGTAHSFNTFTTQGWERGSLCCLVWRRQAIASGCPARQR
jgi:hypothetical protein